MSTPAYLFDTNAIIEAVRIECWPALSGGLRIQTVAECVEECRRGEPLSSGYIRVTEEDLSRLDEVHPVTAEDRAALLLFGDEAAALDAGELDLFAHAGARTDYVWLICSPDRASVRLAVAMEWADRLVSLEEAMDAAGARRASALRRHFTRRWLSAARTDALLGGGF